MSNNTSNIAIKVENLGKRYFIRHEKKESYETFHDVLINGGMVGIIGWSDAGKSTLLEVAFKCLIPKYRIFILADN